MDNIFSNSPTAGVQASGRPTAASWNTTSSSRTATNATGPLGGVNFQPVNGNPLFTNAPQGIFTLQEGSAAIDAARSELDLNTTSTGAFVGTLVPTDNQVLERHRRHPQRPQPAAGQQLLQLRQPLNSNAVSNELTLPGYPPKPPPRLH